MRALIFVTTTLVLLPLLGSLNPAFTQGLPQNRNQAQPLDAESLDAQSIDAHFAARHAAPMSFDELLDYALTHAPPLRQAELSLQRLQADQATADRLLSSNPRVELESSLSPQPLTGLELTFTQPIDLPGQRRARQLEAASHHDVRQAHLFTERQRLHTHLRRLYFQALVSQQHLDLARQSVTFADELLQIASQRFDLGEEPRLSVILAQADRADAHQQLIAAWSSYHTLLFQLANLIGWNDALLPTPPTDALPPLSALSLGPDQLIELAIAHDPLLASARAQQARYHATNHRLRLDARPAPTLGLRYQHERPPSLPTKHKLFLLLGLDLPLFDRNHGELLHNHVELRLLHDFITTRQQSLAIEVREALHLHHALFTRHTITSNDVLPALQQQLDLLEEAFLLGEINLLDTMNARDRLLDARRQHLQTLNDYLHHTIDLEILTGQTLLPPSSP